MTRERRGARAVHLAPWGLYSRYMLGAYLRHTAMVAAALMSIALTIDLWPQVPLFHGGPLEVMFDLAQLAILRLPDLLPPFIPFATFLGVVWSESAFTESRERLLIWNSGRSPIFCLVPALLAGLALGAGLFVVDAWIRPAAIHVQIDEKLGREGIRLDRSASGGNHWIALPDGLLRAEIEYGPPLKLHDVTVYKLDSDGHLAEVDTAEVATPRAGDRWLLENGHYWRANAADRGDVLSTAATQEENEIPFRSRTMAMTLDSLWLRNLGLSPQYLRLPELRALARAPIMSRDLSGYRTFALVTVLLAGYLAHFASKAFILMGEFGYIAPFLGGWLAPLLLIAAVAGALSVIQKKRGLGLRLQDTPHYSDATSE
jgi:lipopolysaccharide export system permease protein